jgi:hypothetical protein
LISSGDLLFSSFNRTEPERESHSCTMPSVCSPWREPIWAVGRLSSVALSSRKERRRVGMPVDDPL